MEEILRQFSIVGGAMWRRRWIGLAVAWIVAVVGAVIVWSTPDRFEASARVYVDTQTVLKPLMAGLAVQPNIDEQIGMLARTIIARPNIEKIMHSANLDVSGTTQVERERMVDELTKRLRFTSSGRENIYTISYQDTSPDRSRRVVQDLLSLFVESGLGNKRRDSESARRFIDDQIKTYEQKLAESENRLKEFKLKNLGVTSGTGADYFARMTELTAEAAKVRQELRSAEEVRDAYKRELAGEDPIMLPDINVNAASSATPSEYNSRIDALRKQLDELLRRYTDQHPDVASTRRLIAQLEGERKQEIEARKQTAMQSPSRLSTSTNPVFQRIKIALAEAEANVASLRSRVSETEGRLAQLRAAAGKVPQIEAELAQLNRDYEVLQKNYQALVGRRESASLGEDVNSAGLAEFRIIDPPRVAPTPVFPNRLALIFVVLVAAVGAGLAASFAMARARPTFHAVAALREFTQRPVLGSVSMLPTDADVRRRRLANVAFGSGLAGLLVACGLWVTVVSMGTRV